jgi:hypothetical protein
MRQKSCWNAFGLSPPWVRMCSSMGRMFLAAIHITGLQDRTSTEWNRYVALFLGGSDLVDHFGVGEEKFHRTANSVGLSGIL